jgi:hypothetical protein
MVAPGTFSITQAAPLAISRDRVAGSIQAVPWIL